MPEYIMKLFHASRISVLAALAGLLMLGLAGCAANRYEPSYYGDEEIDDVEYLSYYGDWIYYPPYGTVWYPDAAPGWEPFYYGNWVWTDDGWAWNSYEPFGWLVFHYGSWGFGADIGWFWVPGDIWYPAAVEWYTFDDYAAWAPMPPAGMIWPAPWDPYDVDVWIVVDVNDFNREEVGRYRVRKPAYRKEAGFRTMTRRAPEILEIERLTRKKMPPMEVRKEPVNVRLREMVKETSSGEKFQEKLKKIVLPQTETKKVDKYAPRIKKEILTDRNREEKQPVKSTEQDRGKTERERKSTEPQKKSTEPQKKSAEPERKSTDPERSTSREKRRR